MDFFITGDGSKTLYHPSVGEHYHSKHGAVQESKHVFLRMGLTHFLSLQGEKIPKREISILEVGFGTGLNFLLTADYCQQQRQSLFYTGIEAYPLPRQIIQEMDYQQVVDPTIWQSFSTSYESALLDSQRLLADIRYEIAHQKALDFQTDRTYQVLYFDAFAAVHQPEMWSEETLGHLTQFLEPGGVFVTYAITGQLKRTMKGLGFSIEKVPGAPGKREMLRAVKS